MFGVTVLFGQLHYACRLCCYNVTNVKRVGELCLFEKNQDGLDWKMLLLGHFICSKDVYEKFLCAEIHNIFYVKWNSTV